MNDPVMIQEDLEANPLDEEERPIPDVMIQEEDLEVDPTDEEERPTPPISSRRVKTKPK